MKNLQLIIFFLILGACKNAPLPLEATQVSEEDASKISLNQNQEKQINIVLGQLEKKDMHSTIKVTGQIDVPPQNLISVSAPMGGYLLSTNLLPGSKIVKGQVIATLEDQKYIELQQEYLLHKSNLNLAEKEYHRQKTLNQSQAASDKIFQQAENEYQKLKINIQALSEKLKIINIDPDKLSESTLTRKAYLYSPIHGFVSHVHANIGKYLNPSDVLFELINPTDIHLNLKIFEKDISNLFIGQKLSAYTTHEPDRKFPCEIILIGKNIGDDHSVEVHCHFDKYEKSLIPGMYMNADLVITTSNAYSLPSDAIVDFEGKNYVFIQNDKGTYEIKEIKIGAIENAYTEVKESSLVEKDKIVIKGAYALLMAMKNNELSE